MMKTWWLQSWVQWQGPIPQHIHLCCWGVASTALIPRPILDWFFERACVLHSNHFGRAQRVQSWFIHAWSTAYSSLTWTTLGIGNKTCVLRLRVYCRLGSTIKRRNIRSAFACCVPLEVYASHSGISINRIFVAMSSFISALSEAQTNNSNIIHILGGIWWLSRGTNHCSHTSQWTFQNREMWFRAMLRS